MSTPYPYTKEVNSDELKLEILASSIATPFDHIDATGSDVSIVFQDALSDDDKTTLDGIVANHVNAPPPPDPSIQANINTLTAYLNNSNATIANTARAVMIANLAPKLPSGMIATINAQIAARLGG